MWLTRSFIVVLVAIYGSVSSSPYQTYNSTNSDLNSIPRAITLRASQTQVEHTEMVETYFKDFRNTSAEPQLNSKSRSKRSIFNLISMLGSATDCTRPFLMWYGSYCGAGGSGRPVDAIDRCCQLHDLCYTRVMEDYDLWISLYLRPYKWYSNRGYPVCARNQYKWKWEACRCDLWFTQCLNIYGCPTWWRY